jgi:hypothetical protein
MMIGSIITIMVNDISLWPPLADMFSTVEKHTQTTGREFCGSIDYSNQTNSVDVVASYARGAHQPSHIRSALLRSWRGVMDSPHQLTMLLF